MRTHESAPTLRRPTLLLADDEPTTLEVMAMFLCEAGYDQILRTSDAREVVPIMEAHHPDLLLLNLMMPHQDGIQLLRAIRVHEALQEIPVIIVTGSTDPESKQRAMDAGASDFLRKPIDPSELSLRVRNTLSAVGQVLLPAPRGFEPAPAPEPKPEAEPVPSVLKPGGGVLVSSVLDDDERSTAILRSFAERLRVKLEAMEKALADADYAELRSLGHWLKGAAGTVGLAEFVAPADELRAHAREAKPAEVEATIQQIWELVDRIVLAEPQDPVGVTDRAGR